MRAQLMFVLLVCCLRTAAFADGGAPETETQRIRPQDGQVRRSLATGAARSATLRTLVDRIEASRVIVYAGMTPRLPARIAGRLTWMTSAGGFRYVRVDISTDLSPNLIIATLAHELQHVVEVIEDPGVVDESSLVALYRRIGRPSPVTASAGWETAAAQETGHRVRRELAADVASLAVSITGGNSLAAGLTIPAMLSFATGPPAIPTALEPECTRSTTASFSHPLA